MAAYNEREESFEVHVRISKVVSSTKRSTTMLVDAETTRKVTEDVVVITAKAPTLKAAIEKTSNLLDVEAQATD